MASTKVEECPPSTTQSGRRLNMQHGFVKFIWRNQIDRDEYHKIQEKRKTDIKEKLKRRTSAGAADGMTSSYYIPPPLRRQQTIDSDSSSSSGIGSVVRSESDSQEDEQSPTSPQKPSLRMRTDSKVNYRPKSTIIGDEKEAKIREGVRRRFERSSATIDDLCSVFTNSSIQDKEDSEKNCVKAEVGDLFIIQLLLPNGENLSINVPKTAQAARLAKTISRQHGFDDLQCRNLRIFIENEIEKRTGC